MGVSDDPIGWQALLGGREPMETNKTPLAAIKLDSRHSQSTAKANDQSLYTSDNSRDVLGTRSQALAPHLRKSTTKGNAPSKASEPAHVETRLTRPISPAPNIVDGNPVSPTAAGKAIYDFVQNMQGKSLSESMWAPKKSPNTITIRNFYSSTSNRTSKPASPTKTNHDSYQDRPTVSASTQTDLTMMDLAALLTEGSSKSVCSTTKGQQSEHSSDAETNKAVVSVRPPIKAAKIDVGDESTLFGLDVPHLQTGEVQTDEPASKEDGLLCPTKSDITPASTRAMVPPHLRQPKEITHKIVSRDDLSMSTQDTVNLEHRATGDESLVKAPGSQLAKPTAGEDIGKDKINTSAPTSAPPRGIDVVQTAPRLEPIVVNDDTISRAHEKRQIHHECEREEGELSDEDIFAEENEDLSPQSKEIKKPAGKEAARAKPDQAIAIPKEAPIASSDDSRPKFNPLAYGAISRLANKLPDRTNELVFESWGAQIPRARPAAQIRTAILRPLPPNATPAFVSSIVFGGPLERIHIHNEDTAMVTFLDGSDCQHFYEATGNGLFYGKTEDGKEKFVDVKLAKEVEVVGGKLSEWIAKGFTRCVKAMHVDKEITLEAMKDMALGQRRALEQIEELRHPEKEFRVVVFTFSKINDAVTMLGELSRDEDWEQCILSYADDPCAQRDKQKAAWGPLK